MEFNICDLCAVYLHCNDWVANCRKDASHDYCLPCTYSMTKATVKFEKYLRHAIQKCIGIDFTTDCIRIVVEYTIGHVTCITFH